MYTTTYPAPVGLLYLESDGVSITGLWIKNQKYFDAARLADAVPAPSLPVFQAAFAWLDAYFSEEPLPPLPPLSPDGSPFRQAVWSLLQEVPYGATTTYGALARQLCAGGVAASAQAVGGAVGHNPISILIPCHRVLGADGSLTGYAGGIDVKRFLLELEQSDA